MYTSGCLSALSPPGARWWPQPAWKATAGPRLHPHPAAAPPAPQGKCPWEGLGVGPEPELGHPLASSRLCPGALRLGLAGHWAPRGWSSRRGATRGRLRELLGTSTPGPAGWVAVGSQSWQELAQLCCPLLPPLLRYVPWLAPTRSHLGAERGRGPCADDSSAELSGCLGLGVNPLPSPVTLPHAFTHTGGLALSPAAGAARPSPSQCPHRCKTTSASSRTCSRPPSTRPHGEREAPAARRVPEDCREHPISAPLGRCRASSRAQCCRLRTA